MDTDRCGYTHHASRFPERGAVTCWRPCYEDRERCVWHADENAKPPEALAEARTTDGERLDGAVLRGVALQGSDLLAGAVLLGADLSEANLAGASLAATDLRAAVLDDSRAVGASFEGANMEGASLEGTVLRGASLRDADLEDATLSASKIGPETAFDDTLRYERDLVEAADPDRRDVLFDAATWVYRELQRAARSNALFTESERYYVREKDLRRRVQWLRGDYRHALLSEASRWVMGYGRNPWRVLAVSAAVVVGCALLFPFLGGLHDSRGPAPSATYALSVPPDRSLVELVDVLGTSLYFSVVTFGTLGYGDVEPVGTAARWLAGVETLVGFGLTALLISVLIARGSWL